MTAGKTDLSNSGTRFGFNPGLDGLRALAVAFVLCQHGGYPTAGGFHGVEVFFVISGYLITSLLISEFESTGRLHYRHFYWRRLVRLGPALVVVVLVTIAFLLATGQSIVTWWTGLIGSLTYTTDFLSLFSRTQVGEPFNYTWSLGIEEQFYLLWPLALVLLIRWGKFVPSVIILAALAASDWAVRIELVRRGLGGPQLLYGPFSHYDALILGCLIAIVLARFPGSRALYWISNVIGPIGVLWFAYILLKSPRIPEPGYDPYFFGQAALASVGIVAWVARNPRGWFSRVMAIPPLAFLGRLSYGIYLWNIVTLLAFQLIMNARPVASPFGFVWVIVTVGIAYLSYRFVETPLRKRFAPPKAHAVEADAAPLASAPTT